MKTSSRQILEFLETLLPPENLPTDVEVMNPYQDAVARPVYRAFYDQFYGDTTPRIGLFGINPGRLGAGVTGVPFTDPIKLEEELGIRNPWPKRAELSSAFIYDVINAFGGAKRFYSQCYISALSPLGYAKGGKNLNYYDIPNWKMIFEGYAARLLTSQLPFLRRDVAFCIGQGENLKFFQKLNQEHGFFKHIVPLPHPRWVMQYRLRSKSDYISEYLDKLSEVKTIRS